MNHKKKDRRIKEIFDGNAGRFAFLLNFFGIVSKIKLYVTAFCQRMKAIFGGYKEDIMKKIRTVLVANRGEIAIRVFRACNEMGIHTVAIYSKEDSLSLHRNRADEAYLVGKGKKPVDAYLDIEDIIRIAKEHHVDAIHPGYGFLAENADFARRCEEEGIVFIGPRVEHLVMFGDKVNARIQAAKAGIPMIPGTKGAVENFDEVRKFAEQYGFPVMIKAVNGGGGRGMRNVDRMEDLEEAYHRARSEAKMAFGDDSVYVEKLYHEPEAY